MVGPNPFTPSFGVSPPLLVGRDDDLELLVEALEEGPGSPHRATLFTGTRGSGKTVMLNAVEDAARARGWVVVSETARPGLVQEITSSSLPRLLEGRPEAYISWTSSMEGQAAGFGAGVSRERQERFPSTPSLRSALTTLADALDVQGGGGVLITIDEVSSDALQDLQELSQVIQHTFREGRQVMFAAAGLPAQVNTLLHAPGATFLRRAARVHLGAVTEADVERAIAEPLHHAGRSITPDALEVAAAGTQGYPFMVQLVGYQAWRASRGTSSITVEQAEQAVAAASRRVGQLVHEPALAPLSAVDRTFLAAMAVDAGPSKIGDVADRMGVSSTYASQYRLRLLEAEVIHAPARGRVDFSLPYLREYLREHATHQLLSPTGSELKASQRKETRTHQQARDGRRPAG